MKPRKPNPSALVAIINATPPAERAAYVAGLTPEQREAIKAYTAAELARLRRCDVLLTTPWGYADCDLPAGHAGPHHATNPSAVR